MDLYIKIFKTLLLFLFINQIATAQRVEVIGYKLDGDTDTLVLGYTEDATIGIDMHLDEIGLDETYIDSTGLYILQRDSINYNCLLEDNLLDPIFYEVDLVSKINFRTNNIKSSLFFEVRLINPELFSTIVINLDDVAGNQLEYIGRSFSDCSTFPPNLFHLSSAPFVLNEIVSPAININTGEPLVLITFRFKDELLTSLENLHTSPTEDNLYPNPTFSSSKLKVKEEYDSVKFFDNLGVEQNLLYSFDKVDGYHFEFDYFPSGVYYLLLQKSATVRTLQVVKM